MQCCPLGSEVEHLTSLRRYHALGYCGISLCGIRTALIHHGAEPLNTSNPTCQFETKPVNTSLLQGLGNALGTSGLMLGSIAGIVLTSASVHAIIAMCADGSHGSHPCHGSIPPPAFAWHEHGALTCPCPSAVHRLVPPSPDCTQASRVLYHGRHRRGIAFFPSIITRLASTDRNPHRIGTR